MTTETNLTLYENCCRTCMKEDSLMFDLFVEQLESSNLADMLISCTKLKIHKDDSLPKQICRYCYNCLISFSHFCNMAHKADEKLREAMTSNNNDVINNNQGATFEIKIEFNDNNDIIESQNVKVNNEKCQIISEASKTPILNVSSTNKNNSAADKVKMKEKSKLKCICCNKKFKNMSKLEHHQQKHINTNRYMLSPVTNQQNDKLITDNGNQDLNVLNGLKASSDLTCIVCSSRFNTMTLLSDHMKKHEKDQVNSCNECGSVFNKLSLLKQHKLLHKDNNHTHIHSLNNKSIPKENVNTNISEPNESNIEQAFRCNICWASYKNINSLSAHMRKHTEKGRVISCKECNKVFKKLSHLKRHEVQHEVNCPFKCSVCPKSFPSEDILKDHINKHKGVRPHSCPVCFKKFSHLSTLTSHIKIHTRDKTHLCPTCGKKFDSSTNLNQHILRHMGLKEFACTMCPKRFVSKGELKSHTITHTGERSYTCDQCGASFTKCSSLTKHKTRHLGLKPYQCDTCLMSGERSYTCDQCGASFTKCYFLTKHKTRHLGLKSYQCDTCLMRFTCKSHLNRHYRIHTGEKPYKCDTCDRAFTQSNDLVKHRRAHVGDKVYKCPQCNEGFRLHMELRQHISEHFVSSQNEATSVSKKQQLDGISSKNDGSFANVTLPQTIVNNSSGTCKKLQINNVDCVKS